LTGDDRPEYCVHYTYNAFEGRATPLDDELLRETAGGTCNPEVAAAFVRSWFGGGVHRLATVADLQQLEPIVVTLGGRDIAVVRVQDDVFAFSAVCSHRAAPLVKGAVTWKRTILCPWHLGTFNLRTGDATAGPPQTPIPTYPVTVVNGEAFLDAEPEDLPTITHEFSGQACVSA
jgi:nitrite reductase/ring-hydroxylating ferredoxin subunit